MLKQLCWDVSHVPQESHWAELQDRAARKATELKCLNMAIHSLFQAASTRLQPKGKVAAGDSHRQLDMVKAEHSPTPCPGKAAGMVLPKRGDSLQAQQSLLSLLGSLGTVNGGDAWEICPFPEGGAESGALWGWKEWEPGRDRDADPAMAKAWFHSPTEAHSDAADPARPYCPVTQPGDKRDRLPSASCSQSCPDPAISLSHPRSSSLSTTSMTSQRT